MAHKLVILIVQIQLLLLSSDASNAEGEAEHKDGDDAEYFNLRITEPWKQVNQVYESDKVANNHGRVAHACAPGIGVILLPKRWYIQNQSTADGLYSVQSKIQKVEGCDGYNDGISAGLPKTVRFQMDREILPLAKLTACWISSMSVYMRVATL